jgi:hypothetical protein
MTDDETLRDFKLRIATAVDVLFPDEGANCGQHEESYYDG